MTIADVGVRESYVVEWIALALGRVWGVVF